MFGSATADPTAMSGTFFDADNHLLNIEGEEKRQI